MNELERFWIWAIDEKPTTERFLELCGKRLNPLQRDDLRDAAELMAFRLDASSDYLDEEVRACYEHDPIAFRDLSLSLHAALSRMREQVPDLVGEDADDDDASPPVASAQVDWRKVLEHLKSFRSQEPVIAVDMTPGVPIMMGGNGTASWLCLSDQVFGAERRREREAKRDRMAEMYESLPIGAVPVERKTPEQLCEMYPERGDR